MQDEITLRDIFLILMKRWRALVFVPLVFLGFAGFYTLFIAEDLYTSRATLSLASGQVQAQLEQRIQLQQEGPLPFEAVRAVAFAEEIIRGVWEELRKEGLLPPRWQDAGTLRGFERMASDFGIKEQASRRSNDTVRQALIVEMSVQAPSPKLASRAANAWAERVLVAVNQVPYQKFDSSLAHLQESLDEAEKNYQEAQARWLEVSRRSTLASDRLELDQLIQERVRLDQALSSLRADLAATRARLESYGAALQSQKNRLSANAASIELVLMNRSFEQAQKSLQQETERLRRSYEQVASELEAFRKRERIPELQVELDRLVARLGEIATQQSALATQIAQKRAELREKEALLLREPRLIEVLREVVADPLVATAVGQDAWPSLESLRLKSQELSPVYTSLFSQVAALKAELSGLESAERALREERARTQSRVEVIRTQLAAQMREKERITLEHAARKAAYESVKARFEQLYRLSPQPFSFEVSNPEYLRLRSAITDAEAERAAQESRMQQMESRLTWINERIVALRNRVAQAQIEQDNAEKALGLSKDSYLALLQKKTDLQIQAAASQSTAQVLVRAYPVYQKTSPNRLLILTAALMVGFLVGLIYVFIAEAVQVPGPSGKGVYGA